MGQKVNKTIDSLKKKQEELNNQFLKGKINRFDFSLSKLVDRRIFGYFRTFIEKVKRTNLQTIQDEKDADKFRELWLRTEFLRKFRKSVKILKKMKIEKIKKEEKENELEKNRIAQHFYEFALKTKSFDSLIDFLDNVKEEKEKMGEMGLLSWKAQKFREALGKKVELSQNKDDRMGKYDGIDGVDGIIEEYENESQSEILEKNVKENFNYGFSQKIFEFEEESNLGQPLNDNYRYDQDSNYQQSLNSRMEENDPALESLEMNREINSIRKFCNFNLKHFRRKN